MAALAAQNYPQHLRVCAIITRETDVGGIENVARLREEFAGSFRLFLHIRDPLLPGIVVGKSAAMAYGGPVLKAACDELGLDPALTMVTDLNSDFRLHPQYFAYISFQFCTAPDRLLSIWQPVPRLSQQHLASAHGGARDGHRRRRSGRCSCTSTRVAW